MKLILAGMSKTGTKSIARAMKILGYEVHDTMEHFGQHRQVWYDYLEDKAGTEEIRKSYEGVDVVTDIPTYHFWEQLLQAFPESKILLTTREEDSWTISAINQNKMMENNKHLNLLMALSPTGWQYFYFLRRYLGLIFDCGLTLPFMRWTDSRNMRLMALRRHNAHVLTNAPKDKLLVYSVKQGWGPLCEFLGVEVPQVPFPHQNVKGNLFEERLKSDPTIQRMKREAFITISVLLLLLSVAGYYLIQR